MTNQEDILNYVNDCLNFKHLINEKEETLHPKDIVQSFKDIIVESTVENIGAVVAEYSLLPELKKRLLPAFYIDFKLDYWRGRVPKSSNFKRLSVIYYLVPSNQSLEVRHIEFPKNMLLSETKGFIIEHYSYKHIEKLVNDIKNKTT